VGQLVVSTLPVQVSVERRANQSPEISRVVGSLPAKRAYGPTVPRETEPLRQIERIGPEFAHEIHSLKDRHSQLRRRSFSPVVSDALNQLIIGDHCLQWVKTETPQREAYVFRCHPKQRHRQGYFGVYVFVHRMQTRANVVSFRKDAGEVCWPVK